MHCNFGYNWIYIISFLELLNSLQSDKNYKNYEVYKRDVYSTGHSSFTYLISNFKNS